jgi:hypothetical protein
MRRRFAPATLVPLALVLALSLTGCGGGGAVKTKGSTVSETSSAPTPSEVPTDLPTELPTDLGSCLPTDLPTDLSSGLPTDLPTDLSGCLPTDLPTEVPTDVPTSAPTEAAGGDLDACAVVTAQLISADLGATTGQAMAQPSSFGDPHAKDCYYVGGEVTVVVQATTRADQDMPANGYSYAGLPGAQEVKGATRGWVYVFPGQDGSDTITSGLILVKGQQGLNFSITVQGHPYSNQNLQKLAQDVLPSL